MLQPMNAIDYRAAATKLAANLPGATVAAHGEVHTMSDGAFVELSLWVPRSVAEQTQRIRAAAAVAPAEQVAGRAEREQAKPSPAHPDSSTVTIDGRPIGDYVEGVLSQTLDDVTAAESVARFDALASEHGVREIGRSSDGQPRATRFELFGQLSPLEAHRLDALERSMRGLLPPDGAAVALDSRVQRVPSIRVLENGVERRVSVPLSGKAVTLCEGKPGRSVRYDLVAGEMVLTVADAPATSSDGPDGWPGGIEPAKPAPTYGQTITRGLPHCRAAGHRDRTATHFDPITFDAWCAQCADRTMPCGRADCVRCLQPLERLAGAVKPASDYHGPDGWPVK